MDLIVQCFYVHKSKFIHVGVDYDYWKLKSYPEIKEKDSYIVCVGYRKRDWDTLLKAYDEAKLKEKLYLIGNPDIKCENKNVVVLPFIPIDKLMTYIVNAKYSVIPLDDFNYSFGQLTILQQMAFGVPILAADVPAIRDYISCSDGIISYKPYNIDDLKEKLVKFSKFNKDDMEQMKKKNIIAVKTLLSEKRMALEFEKICKMLNEQ